MFSLVNPVVFTLWVVPLNKVWDHFSGSWPAFSFNGVEKSQLEWKTLDSIPQSKGKSCFWKCVSVHILCMRMCGYTEWQSKMCFLTMYWRIIKSKTEKLVLVRVCYLQPNASYPIQPLFSMPANFCLQLEFFADYGWRWEECSTIGDNTMKF